MKFIQRFYGSCGHTEDTEITANRYAELTATRVVKTILGDHEDTAQTTIEGDSSIVHIYPDRFFCCNACLDEELKEYRNA